jgi:hypothetical protein
MSYILAARDHEFAAILFDEAAMPCFSTNWHFYSLGEQFWSLMQCPAPPSGFAKSHKV